MCRGLQDVFGEGLDRPGDLGEADEVRGRDQSQLRVLPADERLDVDHVAGGEVDTGLVVAHELPGVDPRTQLAEQREPPR